MSRGRAARVAGSDLAAVVEGSELVKTVTEDADMSSADEALLNSIVAGHKGRVMMTGGSGHPSWP